MADYSKQWCDEFDPDGLPWDFDIYEVLETLDVDSYKLYICEGYGFTAIGKDSDGGGILFMPPTNADGTGDWVPVDYIVKKYTV